MKIWINEDTFNNIEIIIRVIEGRELPIEYVTYITEAPAGIKEKKTKVIEVKSGIIKDKT